MAEFRRLTPEKIAELTREKGKSTKPLTEQQKRDALKQHLQEVIGPVAEMLPFPIPIGVAARIIAEKTPSQTFTSNEQRLNVMSMVLMRNVVTTDEGFNRAYPVYYLRKPAFVALAAITARYNEACDRNADVQQLAADRNKLNPANINAHLPLARITRQTRRHLGELGYVVESTVVQKPFLRKFPESPIPPKI